MCCRVLGCRKYFTNGAKDLGRFEHLLPHIVHNEAALLRITSSWSWLLILGDHDWNMFKLCKTLHLNQNWYMCPHWSTLLTCIIFCSSQLQFGKSFQNKVVFSTFHILTILNKHVHLRYSAKSFSTNMFSLFFNLPEVFSSRTKYINSVWSFWEVELLFIGRYLKVWFGFLFKDNTSNLSIFFLLFLASSLGGGVLVVDVAGGCLLLPWLSWCLMF